MAVRRPLVLVSGTQSELPDGDSVIGVAAGTLTAGSGLVGGGAVSNNIRLDVELAPNPSGLIWVDSGDSAQLGFDGSAQASGTAALSVATAALASGNAALVDASGAQSDALTALASGNAAIGVGVTALASGNAALVSADARLLKSGDTATGQIVFIQGTAAAPAIVFGDTNTGIYRSATDELAIAAGGVQVFKVDASGVASFISARGVDLPQGDNSQRPAGNTGITRYNTVASGLEVYTTHPINWQPLASLDRVQLFQRAQRGVISGVGLVSGTVTLDFEKANNFSMILGGTTIINTPTDLKEGQSGVIYIQQDSVGSRTASYASEWEFANGATPTLTTTVSGVDALCYATRSSSSIAANLLNNLS